MKLVLDHVVWKEIAGLFVHVAEKEGGLELDLGGYVTKILIHDGEDISQVSIGVVTNDEEV